MQRLVFTVKTCLIAAVLMGCVSAAMAEIPPYEIKTPVPELMSKKPPVYLKVKDKIKEVTLQMPDDFFEVWVSPERELPESGNLVLLAEEDYPKFDDDLALQNLDYAINCSLAYFTQFKENRTFTASGIEFTKAEIVRSLWMFKEFLAEKSSMDDLREFIAANFDVYQTAGRGSSMQVMFTGYFEPVYKASREQTDLYCYPIYARPDDMVFQNNKTGRVDEEGNFVPYHTREEIDGGRVLEEKAKVLAWLDNPLDGFFLQIQGSGRVVMEDGKELRLNYDTQNGHKYVSVGRLLVDEGHLTLEGMSMQAIYDFFTENPEMCEPFMYSNPSYVFFKEEEQGPFGSLCVPVTPERSIALDRKVYPPGIMMLVEAVKPELDKDGKIKEWKPMTRFVLHQDAGGAIKGPSRGDIFWGSGEYAMAAAGHLQHFGKLYFFLPKN